MINPDIENIILISDSDFKQLEIENVAKLRTENKALKTGITVVLLLCAVIVVVHYYNENYRKVDIID